MTIRPFLLLALVCSLGLAVGCDPDDPNIKDDTSGEEFVDEDGDGYGTDEDCDDSNADVYPGSEEICDEIDNDCDGEVDEGTDQVYYGDVDGDGYGDPDIVTNACELPSGYVENAEDCDDGDASQYPGADEVCNDEDDDCDGEIDEDAVDAPTWYYDEDGDGFGGEGTTEVTCDQPSGYYAKAEDCDDADPLQFPGADEFCNGEDDDCDGEIDEDSSLDVSTWYADADGDGYGDAKTGMLACAQPKGYVADATDCDDADAAQYPGADEYCNGDDDDCDGVVDEDDAVDVSTWYADTDGDGFGDAAVAEVDCTQPTGFVADNTDCDDTDLMQNPDASEVCNGEDDDCDGDVDEDDALDVSAWFADSDGDGFGDPATGDIDCDQPKGYVADNTDCDDTDDAQYPGADEYCNGEDDDCDGDVDEDDAVDVSPWFADSDGDGFGDPATGDIGCDQPKGYVADNTDCDDTDDEQYPGADEYCNGEDDDCDGDVDEDDAVDVSTWYEDADGDGFGNSAVSDIACYEPKGYVSNGIDCDDTDDAQYPGADEYCNEEDDDCDGTVDEDDAVDVATWYEDADGDFFGDAASTDIDCEQPTGYVDNDLDCDDTASAVNPAADEECDSIDNDCDGDVDEDDAIDASTWYADADSDGYGDAADSLVQCYQPTGYILDDTDCDDTDPAQYPGADEYCNGEDDDCDGDIDEDGEVLDGDTWYADTDGDGAGDPSSTILACTQPSGYVDNSWDCDDTDATEPVVADATAGSSSGVGTIASPLDLIQDAVDIATQCVIAMAGTYSESVTLAGIDITLTGVDGADDTIIDAVGTGGAALNVVSGETSATVISGFTLVGDGHLEEATETWDCTSMYDCYEYYFNYCGGGAYVQSSSPVFQGVKAIGSALPAASSVEGTTESYYVSSYGGGFCFMDSMSIVSGCEASSNSADQGGGVYIDESSSVTVTTTLVAANEATNGAGVQVETGHVDATNVVSLFNSATDDGGGVYLVDASASLTNVSFAGDDAPAVGGVQATGSSVLNLVNSIVYGAGTGAGVGADGAATTTLLYNDLYGNLGGNVSGITDPTGTDGNISEPPIFNGYSDDGDHTNDDLTLHTSSPCIDAGDPTPTYDDADGSTNDMGAYGGPGGDW